MPTREDPFGEYDHLVPVPLEQAAWELQIAEARVNHMRTAVQLQQRVLNDLRGKLKEHEKEYAEKHHLLYLSASNAFIPPR